MDGNLSSSTKTFSSPSPHQLPQDVGTVAGLRRMEVVPT